MPPENEGTLPLGVLRQACMKLESFMTDIREIMEENELVEEDRQNFDVMVEMSGRMLATIVNMVGRELGEEDFLAETPDMDTIDPWPMAIEENIDDESPLEEEEIE